MVLNKAWSNILDTHFTTWGRKEILPLTFFKKSLPGNLALACPFLVGLLVICEQPDLCTYISSRLWVGVNDVSRSSKIQ